MTEPTSAPGAGPASERTRIRRLPERGLYDRGTIDAILDEALICHVGFVDEDGGPVVIPTIHARIGDTVYLHGSPASRMLRSLKRGAQLCLTATLVDGIVLARSPFHSSMNYRSVVVFGESRPVDDPDEKWRAFRAVTEHAAPGRWDDSRQPTPKETAATTIVALDLDEASAKVRTGPPNDDDEDVPLPHWAGVIPLSTVAGPPEPAPDNHVDPPGYVTGYRRPGAS